MAQNLPELAIDDDFSSEAFNADENGIYTEIVYYRKDGTVYMRSALSHSLGDGRYGRVTLSYYDVTGKIRLHDEVWELSYDINRKITEKKKVI